MLALEVRAPAGKEWDSVPWDGAVWEGILMKLKTLNSRTLEGLSHLRKKFLYP